MTKPSRSKTYGATIQVPKAAGLIAATLRAQIVRGIIGEGEALPTETDLMEQFGVSRPTLREALRVLESEALISVHRGVNGGARAHRMTADVVSRYAGMLLQSRGTTVADVYEAQSTFEPACVRKLAETRSDETLRVLRSDLEQERRALRDGDDAASRIGFHHLLISLSGNQTLLVLSEQISYVLQAAAAVSYPVGVEQHRALADHEEVVERIAERDGDGAYALWRMHLEDATRRALGQPGGDQKVVDILS